MRSIMTEHNDAISVEVRRYVRDVLDHATQAADRITSHDDVLSSLVQAALGKVAMQQNTDMRKISAWVAIAAAPTAIAGHLRNELRPHAGVGLVVGLPRGVVADGFRVHAAVSHVPPQQLALICANSSRVSPLGGRGRVRRRRPVARPRALRRHP